MIAQGSAIRARASIYYTVADIAGMCGRKPSTIYTWLYLMRHRGLAPKPGQVNVIRLNAVRRRLDIRDDYAALMQAVFIDKTIRLDPR